MGPLSYNDKEVLRAALCGARRRGLPVAYKPVPFALDQAPPDITIGQTMWFLQLSARAVQRLISDAVLDSFVLGVDNRRIVFDSVLAYREACRAQGPQLSQRPVTGKRPPGRPRKPRPEEHPQMLAEYRTMRSPSPSQEPDPPPRQLVPDAIVRRELGISAMSPHRGNCDASLGFPAAVVIPGRKFRFRDLEAFKTRLVEEAASGDARTNTPTPHRRAAKKPLVGGGVNGP
jgi:hypothetical protein